MNKTFAMNKRANILILLALLLLPSALKADEGMWLLGRTDPKAMAVARSLGLQLTDEQLYGEDGTSLKDCVLDFGDFCSGVIVSKDGLVFTNHHCGFSAIQKLSTPEDDILGNGFVARTRSEERPARGLYVKVWQRTEDVTDEVLTELRKNFDDPDQGRKLGKAREAVLYNHHISGILARIAAKAEAKAQEDSIAGRGIVCEAKAFEGGRQFLLNYYRQYSDIRLVFTVPQSLGKFGGDTDNWMWPRQTADFSVFRIYADADGLPAEYSEDNVPLHPRRWAEVSLDGYRQGDYCMTIGYPGSTSRYLSCYGIGERTQVTNIPMIQVRGVKQGIWRRWMQAERPIGIKYASKFASSSNYWKNSQGMNEAVSRLGIIEQKEQREQELREWFSGDKQLRRRFANVLPTLRKGYAQRHNARYAQGFANETFLRGIEILSFARFAQTYASMPDSAYRASLDEYIAATYRDYDARVDEEVMAALLENYATQVSSRYLPAFYKEIHRKYHDDYAAFARDIFSGSRLTSYEGWYRLTHARVRSSLSYSTPEEQADADRKAYRQHVKNDPVVRLYNDVQSMLEHSIIGPQRSINPVIAYNENLLTQAVLEKEFDEPHYSDANFTQRMSFGIVSDYTNAGTHHEFFTTMPSLLAKAAQGEQNPDYRVQADVLALLKSHDYGRYADSRTGELQLCFLTTNDITGGNSGSPMFDGRGRLIGLAFDGNWDALSSDISFDTDLTRCIGVDIRFVLWLIDKWGNAQHLIQEILPE